ncbi:MAG: helix-hairpin-helix domain-containing protein, partial [Candidatus Omnitrophota bacterium]
NINTATLDMLKRLPGLDEEMAFKIATSGMRPYTSVYELLLVEGMTAERFRKFKDVVTVYGQGKVNINTAGKAALVSIGLDEELADIIMRFRKTHKIEPPKDKEGEPVAQEAEYGFSSLATLVSDLSSAENLSLRQEQDLISAQSRLDVKSAYLRFNVIPQVNNKDGTRYSAIIDPAKKKVLSWREY